jgi:hypothetical protein
MVIGGGADAACLDLGGLVFGEQARLRPLVFVARQPWFPRGYALAFASITLSQICSWRLIVVTMSVGLRAAFTQKPSCGSSSVSN